MSQETETKEPQDKLFPDQLDGEEVQFLFRKHPIVMRKGLVFGMFGPLVGVLPTAIWPTLGFGWFFAGLFGGIALGMLIFFPFWINWYYSMFIITDIRMIQITQKGLFHKSFIDLSLKQIQSVNYEVNGLQATLLGYGTILVQTYMGDLVVHEVHHPAHIYKKLITLLRSEGIEPVMMNPGEEEVAEIEAEEA
jgi:uncharacterized membrane protein YdbT with pleckstrin-like domain